MTKPHDPTPYVYTLSYVFYGMDGARQQEQEDSHASILSSFALG